MNTKPILLALLLIGPSAQAKDVTVQVNGLSVRLDIASPARPDATNPTIVFESGLGTPGKWLNVRNASLRRFATGLARGTFVETTTSSHQIQSSEPGLIAWAIERVLRQR